MSSNWIEQCAKVEVVDELQSEALSSFLQQQTSPVLLKGLVANWPVVKAAQNDLNDFCQYLQNFQNSENVTVYRADAKAKGRIFYNDDLTGFNFQVANKPLGEVLGLLQESIDSDSVPTYYVGSTLLERFLPGFREENTIDLDVPNPLVSLWVGNQSRIAAHYDFPDNLACCIAGKRRFTLFSPEQVANLYVGPLDFTPSGQAISLVDFRAPDLKRFPKFEEAMQNAVVADMEPGDALFVPSMWWHHVESLSAINGLVNYWWRSSPAYLGNPTDVLMHALQGVGHLPKEQKQAWKKLFEHYVFSDDNEAVNGHIPKHVRGMLGQPSEAQARNVKERLMQKLRR